MASQSGQNYIASNPITCTDNNHCSQTNSLLYTQNPWHACTNPCMHRNGCARRNSIQNPWHAYKPLDIQTTHSVLWLHTGVETTHAVLWLHTGVETTHSVLWRVLVHLTTQKTAQPGNTIAQFSMDTPTFYVLASQKYTSYSNGTRTGL